MSEELVVNIAVKTEDQQRASESAKRIKESFNVLADPVAHENFTKLARSFALTEQQVKKLVDTLGGGQFGGGSANLNSVLNNLAISFGKGGIAFGIIEAVITAGKAAWNFLYGTAERSLQMAQASRRIGTISGAQLNENVKLLERMGVNTDSAIAAFETLAEKQVELSIKPNRIRSYWLSVTDFASRGEVLETLDKLEKEKDPTKFANIIREWGQSVRKAWEDVGDPGRGAQEERRLLEWWTGSDAFQRLKPELEFKKVTEEQEKAYAKTIEAGETLVDISGRIAANMQIIKEYLLNFLLGSGPAGPELRGLLAASEAALRVLEAKPEDREAVLKQLWDEMLKEASKYSPKDWADWFLKYFWLGPGVPLGTGGVQKGRLDDYYKEQMEKYDREHPSDKTNLPSTKLFEDYSGNQEDLLREEKKLVDNLQLINALLSQSGGIALSGGLAGAAAPRIPALAEGGVVHRRRKALVGERGPEAIVGKDRQRVAANPTLATVGAQGPETVVPLKPGESLTPANSVFPGRPGIPRAGIITGPLPTGVQTGPSSFFGNLSEAEGSRIPGGWVDNPGDWNKKTNKPLEQWSGAPRNLPAVSTPFRVGGGPAGAQQGALMRVQNPMTGEWGFAHQGDIGPNMWHPVARHKAIDINAAQAEQWGYVGTAQQSKLTGKPVYPTGKNVSFEFVSSQELEEAKQSEGGLLGLSAIPASMRKRMDGALNDEVKASGNLNVKVEAPAGTTVKATGGGMFEDNVNVDRTFTDATP
jgi:hypothetical protein